MAFVLVCLGTSTYIGGFISFNIMEMHLSSMPASPFSFSFFMGKTPQIFSFYHPETILTGGVKSLLSEQSLGLNPFPKVSGCVTLDKLLTMSVPLKPQLGKADDVSSLQVRCEGGMNDDNKCKNSVNLARGDGGVC